MTRSTISPDWYWLKKIEDNNLHLLIRWNVAEITIDGDNGSHTEYEYDEQVISVPIPDDVMTADELNTYMDANEDALTQIAKDKKSAGEQPHPDPPEDIRKEKIGKIRKKLKPKKPKAT